MASDTIFTTVLDKFVGVLALDPTGNYVALGGKKPPGSSGCIFILDLKDDKKSVQKTFLFRRNSEITHVVWNQLSSNLLASASNQFCEIWDVNATGSLPQAPLQSVFEAHQLNVTDMAWSRTDRNVLATCSGDKMVKQWDIRDPKKPVLIKTISAWDKLPVTRIKWNRLDPNILASAHDEGKISIWDIRKTVTPVCNITAHVSAKITGIDWSYSNKDELLCACDTTIKLWRPLISSNPNQCHHIIKAGVTIAKACYTPQNQILGFPLSTNSAEIRLWDMNDLLKQPRCFSGHKGPVASYDWRKGGEGSPSLITLGKDKQLIGWGNFSPEQLGTPAREESYDKNNFDQAFKSIGDGRITPGRRPPAEKPTSLPFAHSLESEFILEPTLPLAPAPPNVKALPPPKVPNKMTVSTDSVLFMNEMSGFLEDIQMDSTVDDRLILFPKDSRESGFPTSEPAPRTFGATFGRSGHLVIFKNNSKIASQEIRTYQDFVGEFSSTLSARKSPSRRTTYSPERFPLFSPPFTHQHGLAKVQLFFPHLSDTSRRLATLYTLDGTPHQICKKNTIAAQSVERYDLIRTWKLLQNVTHPSVYQPYSNDKEFDQFDALWSDHPFGKKIVQGLLDHYQRLGDIQTFAHIVCTLCPPATDSDSPPKPRSENSLSASQVLRFMNSGLLENSGRQLGSSGSLVIRGTPERRSAPHYRSTMSPVPSDKHPNTNDWATKLEQIEEKHATTFLKTATSLLDISFRKKANQYCLAYADLLFCWGLLEKRCQILKYVSAEKDENSGAVHLSRECPSCRNSTSDPYCKSCNVFTVHCSICQLSVSGLSLICRRCKHGGHPAHIQNWFKSQQYCPTGCNCKCSF